MLKLIKKIHELHAQEKAVCCFCLLIAFIIIFNIIVNLIHISVSIDDRRETDNAITSIELRIDTLEKEINQLGLQSEVK